ncbi:prepilin-type N-terminal cleavage/methylation domain-containing protein [Candidatus Dojkabacteria bacterium]|nr:prepilin-type N-terminal cleavage/methylation domain-containing protein [Candidatus Dojkabacteria bacterium]
MKILNKIFKKQEGQSLVEIVVAIGILAIVFSGSWQVLHDSFMSVQREMIELKAHYLVVGGLEAMRSIRDEDWNALTDGTWHYEYDVSGPENMVVILEGGEEVWDIYRRRIEISSVRRDTTTGKITEDPAYDFDPNTKRVDVVVEWDWSGSTRTDLESIYFTNWNRF